MKILSISFFFLFGCLGIPEIGKAQQQQMYFEKYDVKSGLPESFVRDIVEDPKGYIWMATQNGLVRYDGYRYKVYQLGSKKRNLDPSTNVSDLYKDRNNDVWVSTYSNGLFKYNRNKDTFIQFDYPEKDEAISYHIFADDNEGNLWGAIEKDDEENYIWKLDKNNRFEFFGKKFKNVNYINASRIYSGFISKSGKLWFGTNNGFYSYEGKNIPLKGYSTSTHPEQSREVVYLYETPSEPSVFWMVTFHGKLNDCKIVRFNSKLNTYKELKTNPECFDYSRTKVYTIGSYKRKLYNSIYEDKKKQLWFACFDGLVRLNRTTDKFDYFKTGFKYAKPSEIEWIGDIKATKEDSFWLSSPSGLVKFDPQKAQFERYQHDPERAGSVSGKYWVASKMIDHTDAFWVGFGWAGANKSNRLKSAFTIYKHTSEQLDSYPKGEVICALGEKGYQWFADEHAIYKWKEGTNSFVKIYSSDLDDSFIYQGCSTKDGNFCIATTKSLVFYNVKTGKKDKYAIDKIIPGGFLANPFEDGNGIIWLYTSDKGICSFNPKTKKIKAYPYRKNKEKLTAKNVGALDDGMVTSTYVDRKGDFWVGTNYGSLNRYDSKKDCFISYSNIQNKGMTCITSIYEDVSGRFWVGTYQNGIFEFDRKEGRWIRQLNETNGLLFNGVSGINEDALGQLWIATERGLSRINPKNMSVKNFPFNTILTGYTLGTNNQNLYKLDDGRLMTQLSNAVAVFNPKNLDANPFPPKVVLEEIAISNPKVTKEEYTNILTEGKKEIQLSYLQNRIRFNYIGLQYDDPAANTYAYKLDGYDKDWVQAGTQRSVTYTNLSPGSYTFHVKAANSDGVWSTKNDSIDLVISPPWWKTWWAYTLYFLVFIVSIPSYVTYRARTLKRENSILEEKVTIRTNQLTKSIEDLKITQNQLIQSEKMASLGELTAGIAHEIQNPLNFVNNFSEVSIELIEEMQEEMTKGDTSEASVIANDIKKNLEKINHHGRRADSIVKGMLQHSRTGSTIKESTDINKLADEYLRLAYHGLRAKDKSFNADLVTDFDSTLPKINVLTQEIGRVLLNLFTNAFYATHQRQKESDKGYKSIVSVKTAVKDKGVEITVKDNGSGIPDIIKDKIMQPFFTTKPSGEGTGLGLSLSYDIVVKGHGGTIAIDSRENDYTIFTILLPIG
ncbi:sensor histidine kinase [Flavobacterium gilvum]|uniref:histidine kinase n=1 Tax=Flavobacterium gilvum TaxID=1492737 RepID=A0AAC9N4A0_9FLAO|nr:two-component regulator propeller domain-containing protein [Flavobacterium gilvum]AOW10375.1 hypothetical protein EM308_13160 [Flavobacterium gilvum]KFC60685.1 histidine kinase [Flavobacterium gilvum]